MTVALERVERVVRGELHIAPTDLALESGRLYVLLGPTRAGKTSLMRLLAGLDAPSAGRVLVDGRDVTGLPVRQRSIAMVYQQFVNYPSFSVFDNIASPLRLKGMDRAAIAARVREAAAMLRIDHLLDRLPQELSGGQQQRCAIARALVKQADLLLLDEPLVNLDYKLREELRAELKELFARGGSIVVYATTEPLEALMMGGETLVMHEGRVVQQGPTAQVYHHPARLEVAAVFSDPPMNLIDGEVRAGEGRLATGQAFVLGGHLAGLRDGAYRFGVRAAHLSLRRTRESELEIPAEVELADISGSETFVHLHHAAGSWVVQQEGVHGHDLGERARIYVDPAQLFAFAADGTLAAAPVRR